MILKDRRSLTFDDVWIYPQYSEVKSRADVSTVSRVTTNIYADPIFSANMGTVTGLKMMIALENLGSVPVLHRDLSMGEGARIIRHVVKEAGGNAIAATSVGVGEDAVDRVTSYVNAGSKLIVVDIAHADSDNMYRCLDQIFKVRHGLPNFDIMVGNVATPEAVYRLVSHCGGEINGIKVGLGGGEACTTRIKTGVGVGQFSAIHDTVQASYIGPDYNIPICADGGIRSSGDFAKAIGAGASSVMIGKLLAYATESPGWTSPRAGLLRGEVVYKDNSEHKVYTGSAYFDYRDPDAPTYKVREGTEIYLTNPRPVREIVQYLLGGLRSAMSYSNALDITSFHKGVVFVEGSVHTTIEANPRYETGR